MWQCWFYNAMYGVFPSVIARSGTHLAASLIEALLDLESASECRTAQGKVKLSSLDSCPGSSLPPDQDSGSGKMFLPGNVTLIGAAFLR